MNPELKRHLISGVNTFIAGFGLGIAAYIAVSPLDLATFGKSAVFGLFLAGARAGVKLVVENLIVPFFKKRAAPVITDSEQG